MCCAAAILRIGAGLAAAAAEGYRPPFTLPRPGRRLVARSLAPLT